MKRKTVHRTGFTLVEMLVIIAIIIALMAIIIPGISKARERARRVRCAANLRELHEAALNYATDHKRYPFAASSEHYRSGFRVWTKHTTGWVDWHYYESHPQDTDPEPHDELITQWWGDWGKESIEKGAIYTYVRDPRIYVCPTCLWHMRNDKGITDEYRDIKRSYSMNSGVNGAWVASLGSQAGGMSRRMLFADAAYDLKDLNGKATGATWGLKHDGDDDPDTGNVRYFYRGRDGMLQHDRERLGYWHDGKATVVFLDGHVELVHYDRTEEVCTGILP